jgi:hypothetical protein
MPCHAQEGREGVRVTRDKHWTKRGSRELTSASSPIAIGEWSGSCTSERSTSRSSISSSSASSSKTSRNCSR